LGGKTSAESLEECNHFIVLVLSCKFRIPATLAISFHPSRPLSGFALRSPLRFLLLEVGVDPPEPLAERDPFVQQGSPRRRGSEKEGRITPPFPVPKGGIKISRGALARLVGGDPIPPYPGNVRLGLIPFLCIRTDIETRPR